MLVIKVYPCFKLTGYQPLYDLRWLQFVLCSQLIELGDHRYRDHYDELFLVRIAHVEMLAIPSLFYLIDDGLLRVTPSLASSKNVSSSMQLVIGNW